MLFKTTLGNRVEVLGRRRGMYGVKQKTMELHKAIEILEYHQQWRRGDIDEMKYTPKELTEALDLVLSEIKENGY